MSDTLYSAITSLFVYIPQGTQLSPGQIATLLVEKHLAKAGDATPYNILIALAHGVKNEEFFRYDIRVKYVNPRSIKNPPASFTLDGRQIDLKQIKKLKALENKHGKKASG